MFFLALPNRRVAFYQNDNALQRRKWSELRGIIGHSLLTEKISKESKHCCGSRCRVMEVRQLRKFGSGLCHGNRSVHEISP